jgi:Domain of unknown function (DUF4136)
VKAVFFYIAGMVVSTGFLLVGCTPAVQVEKDKQTDFSKYKTFAWINENSGKKSSANDLEDKSVHEAVSNELQRTSWKEVTENPDVLVSYDVLVQRSTRVENSPVYSPAASRLYYNPYTRHYGTIFYPSRYRGYIDYNVPVREGTLTITVTDANSDKTIWQAWTTDEVSSRRLSNKEIESIVKSIFRKFDIAKKQ